MMWKRILGALVLLPKSPRNIGVVADAAGESGTTWGWEADELRLKARLREIEAFEVSRDEARPRPWPNGTVDYDRAVGVENSFYAQDPDARCRTLALPPPTTTARGPIALLLTGQLRTAEFTLPFMELNLIDASRPSDLHVFAHVWSPRRAINSSGGTAAEHTEARLRRLEGLKAMVVEPEEEFVSIVCAFYDARYGAGWCELRYKNNLFRDRFFSDPHGSFLSQWYKLSVGHGLLRRWYRGDDRDPNDWVQDVGVARGNSRVPPLAIVRMRPDHLLTVRWNLTLAALEFQGRDAARAAGGNFLAVWGPSSHSEFCNGNLCPDRFLASRINGSKCYSAPRVDDAFAFGTPAAFDAYAAPYHPYAGKCCELYVQNVLPLAGLVEVGAEQSRGGYFGSLGMPGSCGHRSGHYPLRVVGLTTSRGARQPLGGSASRGARAFESRLQQAFLEYADEPIPYGPLRADSPNGIVEKVRSLNIVESLTYLPAHNTASFIQSVPFTDLLYVSESCRCSCEKARQVCSSAYAESSPSHCSRQLCHSTTCEHESTHGQGDACWKHRSHGNDVNTR
jgi:hypothetical protein